MIEDAAFWQNVLMVGGAFALGGILKGAIGVGTPLLAVPMLALLYDVPTAIVLFAIPNLLPNLWQVWQYREHNLPARFRWRFFLTGAGAGMLGTVVLANIEADNLMLVVAFMVLAYVSFRLMRPGWVLGYPMAERMAAAVGVVAGVLQTLVGISAPVSVTFLNAMQLERRTFIVTISGFFVAVGVLQVPSLIFFGLMTWPLFWLGLGAVAVIAAFMPVGAFLARQVSPQAFNKVILVILTLVALRLLATFVI
ncbi:sulfite exporter TauE/SafE family protein [Shimia abyssi]|uniref:Probable membrane transporter protein n=1 Tax=Shimia abyssi TaxID=1662395 RepID=A0A2P8FE45_9RHOB|nr:sulfite exporter TauE/SafE family protein [Shimia abyssi]PSL19983.1 hypothetical protein CLV88_10441 [Shimia abyssi]